MAGGRYEDWWYGIWTTLITAGCRVGLITSLAGANTCTSQPGWWIIQFIIILYNYKPCSVYERGFEMKAVLLLVARFATTQYRWSNAGVSDYHIRSCRHVGIVAWLLDVCITVANHNAMNVTQIVALDERKSAVVLGPLTHTHIYDLAMTYIGNWSWLEKVARKCYGFDNMCLFHLLQMCY